MKKLPALIWLACLLIAGCSTKKLSSEEALQLLRESNLYPRVLDFDIYCSDPQQAQAILAAGLEKEGLVTVQKTQKLGDVGKPLITFTAKAQPYLLPTTEKEKELEVQKVKLAEEELVAVTIITTESDGKSAVVEYTTTKKATPFAAIRQITSQEKTTRNAHFILQDNEWQLGKVK